MTNTKRDLGDNMTTAEAIRRFRLVQDAQEDQAAQMAFHDLLATINMRKPMPHELWQLFGMIWDAARVAGAMQMRRSIVDGITRMQEIPAPFPSQQEHAPAPASSSIEVVEDVRRPFCPHCEKEAN